MVKPKIVIMWGREDPVSWAIATSLGGDKEREVIRVSDEKDLMDVRRIVEATSASAIIIHQGDHAGNAFQPILFLRQYPDLKVIVVSLENNSIEVYNRKKVFIRQISDLLAVVEE